MGSNKSSTIRLAINQKVFWFNNQENNFLVVFFLTFFLVIHILFAHCCAGITVEGEKKMIDESIPGNGKPWKQQYAINTEQSGDITSWTTGPSLPGVLGESQAIVTKNRVYLLGGYISGYVSTVYTALINADGTLGTWTTGPSLPGVLGESQAIVTKNRVYLLGGVNGSNYVSTVYTAPIQGGLNDYSPYYDGTIKH